MKVKDRMTKNVVIAEMNTSITEAFRLMKENDIRRLPVMENGKLAGIVTLADLNQAAPSSATTLSVHELNYLLAKIKLKDIIAKDQELLTVGPENYIETAAKLMRQNTVSGLPVMDNEKLVGIVTETDLFDALIDILGVTKAHSRIDIYVPEGPGSIAEITGLIAGKRINILNTVVYYDDSKEKYKMIIRMEALDCEDIVKEIKEHGYEIESLIVRDTKDNQ